MEKDGFELVNALYLVPTPIGNLDDITLRAIKVLSQVDFIACEDTRHTGMLLKNLNIHNTKLVSYHEHNEAKKTSFLSSLLLSGKSIALVSDAGTPSLSDPGYLIVQEAVNNKIKIISLPGPSAFLSAIVASGFPINEFTFWGFPPAKKGRKKFIQKVCAYQGVSALYESRHKILKLLDELYELNGDSINICIGREISKIYEEYIRGNPNQCKDFLLSSNSVKGEFTVIIQIINK